MAQTKHILILIQRTVSSIEHYTFEVGQPLSQLYTAYARRHPAPSNQTLGDFFAYSVSIYECEDEGQANEFIRDIRDKVMIGDELEAFMDNFAPVKTLIASKEDPVPEK